MHFRNARKRCFRRCISESAFFKKNLTYFGNALPKTPFRKFISEILRVLQIKQNSPLPLIIYPNLLPNSHPKIFLCKPVPSYLKGSVYLLYYIQKSSNPFNR